jgi:hypothetical protein
MLELADNFLIAGSYFSTLFYIWYTHRVNRVKWRHNARGTAKPLKMHNNY